MVHVSHPHEVRPVEIRRTAGPHHEDLRSQAPLHVGGVSVENGSFPIYQLEERFFKDSDRKKVLKMQRDWNVKYNELSGRMYNGTMQMRTERYPYDQLELE